MTSKGSDQTARMRRLSEPLLVAHTTLLEISCRGSNVSLAFLKVYHLYKSTYPDANAIVVSSRAVIADCICRKLIWYQTADLLKYVLYSQGHNLYKLQYISLKEVKLCLFNNDFKVRPSKVTYLGYI